ncbi:MAG TPA: vWA domain-containing protein [Polyangiaceae bacterium]|nr:vWA domain-containing protein [Polyangiaceae bacterium]
MSEASSATGRVPALVVFLVSGLAALGCGSRSGLDAEQLDRLDRTDEVAATPLQAAPQAPGCVDFVRSYASVPPAVMLLIDRSTSMGFNFAADGDTRWNVLREAIVDPEQGLLASLDQRASVGLMLYTGEGGFNNPAGCPLITRVDAQFGNVDRVRDAYLAAEPALRGDTPTGESIAQATEVLSQLGSAAPRYILLATDGEPDTCAQPKPQEGMPTAIAAAQDAFARGIRVYTVGVSEGIGADRVQQMANAGAGKDPSLVYGIDVDAEQPLFANSDPKLLAAQLAGIIGDVRTCTIELGTPIGNEGSLQGRLILDGRRLQRDAREGWTFVDDDTLSIHGTACDTILGTGQRLEVRFPCDAEGAPLPR